MGDTIKDTSELRRGAPLGSSFVGSKCPFQVIFDRALAVCRQFETAKRSPSLLARADEMVE
jgi:hypothetical protein